MSNEPNTSVLRAGIRIEGSGASKGAIILANKTSDADSDVVLCFAAESPHHPFVVWNYEHESGMCRRGDYFDNLKEALITYEERSW
jgi:hypothetical protein